MKQQFLLLLAAVTPVMTCLQPYAFRTNNTKQVGEQPKTVSQNGSQAFPITINPGRLFTEADAEKILGTPSHLSNSSTKQEADALTYRCKYEADTKDRISQKTGTIYFLFEDFHLARLAQKKYKEIKNANEHLGIEVLANLGEEAYYHSDGTNFYFIMVRKGAKVFNLKVNKITSTTNLEAFKRTAKKIANSVN